MSCGQLTAPPVLQVDGVTKTLTGMCRPHQVGDPPHDMTIAEVAENFQMTRAAVKKHLAILKEGDLIAVHAEGRTRVNTLNGAGMKRIVDWLNYFDSFWDDRLATLKSEIEKDVQ